MTRHLAILPESNVAETVSGPIAMRDGPAEGRVAPRAVRISITDRCDLACVYCRPHRRDEYLPPEQRMVPESWGILVAGLVARGVTRVRITGGEPLLHPRVVDIVRMVGRVPGIEDVALSTNATRLADLAQPLRDAGLHRLNISIDTLDPARFSRFTRGGNVNSVLQGIETARRVGFEDIKTNTVVVGAIEGDAEAAPEGEIRNDDEVESIVRWAWSMDATPRFIERMNVGEGANLRGRFVPYHEIRARLDALLVDTPPYRFGDRGPARYLDARAGDGRKVGFITGTSDTFCNGCDRLRATSDGSLRPCLATNDRIDVSHAIHQGDLEAIGRGLDAAWQMKPDGLLWGGCTEDAAAAVNMRATGG